MTTKVTKPTTPKKAASKPVTPRKTRAKKDDTPYVPPKKLSKAALWLKEHGPAFKIVDMRAVMK